MQDGDTVSDIYTTTCIGDACVCVNVFAKLDQFLPVRSHIDTKRPVNFVHIATFQSDRFLRSIVLCFLRKTIIYMLRCFEK